MLRICFAGIDDVDLDRIRIVDGRKIYEAKLWPFYDSIFKTIDSLFYNRTFHLTVFGAECVQRMRSNETDLAIDYHSLRDNIGIIRVPVPFLESKTSMIVGYDLNNTKLVEKSGAMGNLKLLEMPVYGIAFLLTFLFILAIAARVLIRHHHKVSQLKNLAAHSRTPHLYLMQLEKVRSRLTGSSIAKELYEEVFSTLFDSGDNHRYIALLFALLCFYLVSSFNAVYKTSCIELHEPPLIKTYEEQIKDAKSLPIFYDIRGPVSHQFKNAPAGTLKARVWSKLKKSGKIIARHIIGGERPFVSFPEVNMIFNQMNRDKYVFIASSINAGRIRTSICGLSSDGTLDGKEELRRLLTFADPSESGDLVGWAVTRQVSEDRKIHRKLSILLQSHIIQRIIHVDNNVDSFTHTSSLAGSTKAHMFKQIRTCSEDYEPNTGDEVKAMNFAYFQPLFVTCFFVACISVVINRIECLLAPGVSRVSKQRQRRPHSL